MVFVPLAGFASTLLIAGHFAPTGKRGANVGLPADYQRAMQSSLFPDTKTRSEPPRSPALAVLLPLAGRFVAAIQRAFRLFRQKQLAVSVDLEPPQKATLRTFQTYN